MGRRLRGQLDEQHSHHRRWLAKFTSLVLELRGDLTVAARLAAVRAELRRLELGHLFAQFPSPPAPPTGL